MVKKINTYLKQFYFAKKLNILKNTLDLSNPTNKSYLFSNRNIYRNLPKKNHNEIYSLNSQNIYKSKWNLIKKKHAKL